MLKKLLFGFVLVVTLLLVVIGVVAYKSVNHAVKHGIETFGPRYTGTAVTVESVSLSPLTGSGTIRGLEINNPTDFKTPYAFRMDEVSVALDVGSVFGDEILVHEVRIIGPDIIYEQGLTGSNIGTLKKMIEERTASAEEEEDQDPPKVVIEKFVMENGKIQLGTSLSEKTVAIPMALIELTDLGRGDGATAADTVRQISAAVTETVINVVAASGKLAETATEAVKGAVEGVSEAGKNAVEGVKKLFK